MPRLKAYIVSDGNDGCCIYFATNSATARREGGAEIGCDWEDIDFCNRRPEFDTFAPGPVPVPVLIEHGWWIECGTCQEQVTESTEQRKFDSNDRVYCCQACMDRAPTTTGEAG